MENESKSSPAATLKNRLIIIVGFVGVLWVLEIIDQVVLGQYLDTWGILPRTLGGLWGIAFCPFLHGGFGHLTANTLPLLVMGGLVIVQGFTRFFSASVTIMLLGGIGVWIFARTALHIGASGLIFGYFGYLVLYGILHRSVKSIVISVFVALFYGGLIWGVLPGKSWVSWEGHLFGFIAGLVAAYVIAGKRGKKSQS